MENGSVDGAERTCVKLTKINLDGIVSIMIRLYISRVESSDTLTKDINDGKLDMLGPVWDAREENCIGHTIVGLRLNILLDHRITAVIIETGKSELV